MEHILFTKEELFEMINESEFFNEKLKGFDELEAHRIKSNMVNEAHETLQEISLGGIKNVANLGLNKLRSGANAVVDKVADTRAAVSNKINSIKSSVDDTLNGIKDAYYKGNIEELENKLLEVIIKTVNEINEKRKKNGQLPINAKSILTRMSNKAAKSIG